MSSAGFTTSIGTGSDKLPMSTNLSELPSEGNMLARVYRFTSTYSLPATAVDGIRQCRQSALHLILAQTIGPSDLDFFRYGNSHQVFHTALVPDTPSWLKKKRILASAHTSVGWSFPNGAEKKAQNKPVARTVLSGNTSPFVVTNSTDKSTVRL